MPKKPLVREVRKVRLVYNVPHYSYRSYIPNRQRNLLYNLATPHSIV